MGFISENEIVSEPKQISNLKFIFFIWLGIQISWAQVSNVAPILSATGNQTYCPGTSVKIVTNMTFTDPDDTGIDAVYIQISSGYVINQDVLTLTGLHPTINASWNPVLGKMTLTGVAGQPTYAELKAAIESIEFSNSSANPSGNRNFSITIGQANYLPTNGHYYEFKPNIGVTWTNAKTLAQSSTYYGLQGYLATITSAEEAQIAGAQTTGAGWIGGSDAETEGTWKWMTGPEMGLVFWTGNFTGFTTNFAYWNTGEPNDQNNEDYAHITAAGVGINGSWNDLSDTGEPSGNYQPKGYIVEYGGTPGDPTLNISTSTQLSIPSITSTVTSTRCGDGTVTLEAVSSTGIVHWYDVPTGGTLLGTGNTFTTPTISSDTVFYAVAHSPDCSDNSNRKPVSAFVTPRPVLTVNSPYYMCEESYKVIEVLTTSGIMFWFDSPTATDPIFLGTNFVVPNIHQDTVYYAEANYNGCLSQRIPVEIRVYPIPDVTNEEFTICENESLVLDAGVPGMSYLWSTGGNSQTQIHTGSSNYEVTITTPAPENCTVVKHFVVHQYEMPVITAIETNELTVTIHVDGNGEYAFSVNNSPYQSSPTFTLQEGGMYTAFVKEIHDCGFDTKSFAVLSVPPVFTPNGDGTNDYWIPKGLEFFPGIRIRIFDRFGKFLVDFDNESNGWNGQYNSTILPADDYWYVMEQDGAVIQKGHFSLKR